MRTLMPALLLLPVLLAAGFSPVSHAQNERLAQYLLSNDFSLVRRAAREMYKTGNFDQRLTDILSEVILESYRQPPIGFIHVDALSWGCRALGASRNGRYRALLEEVQNNAHHGKLRRFAGKARFEVGSGGAQYRRGDIDLAHLRSLRTASSPGPAPGNTASARAPAAGRAVAVSAAGRPVVSGAATAALPAAAPPVPADTGLKAVKPGMTVQEVYHLVGQPTATTTYQSEDDWIPFNYGGEDLARTHLLYRGRGRVICSEDTDDAVSRVQEVIIDPEETGYP